MEQYKRPEIIPNDMGGGNGSRVNERLKEVMVLLEHMPQGIQTICDIGMGKGQLSQYFLERGYQVTGTGLEMESYDIHAAEWKKKGVDIVPCPVEHMPFGDESFDAVAACHILEHTANMGLALEEIRRILVKQGWLLLFIPAYMDQVVAGHVNTGWNLGQLAYVLLLHGFSIKNGRFIHYGQNLCAFVQKSEAVLPPLRGDRGDIHILAQHALFPFQIAEKNGIQDAFEGGRIASINWPGAKKLIQKRNRELEKRYSGMHRFLISICKCLVQIIGSGKSMKLGKMLLRLCEDEYNPKNAV